VLLALVRDRIDDRRALDLVGQYLRRTVDENCLYATVTVGISSGLSALARDGGDLCGAAGSPHGGHVALTYARFMDDWVVLAPTRWSVGACGVRFGIVNETLRELSESSSIPDKTFVGRIERGFTFLGLLDYGARA
jgi:RNA-directed DNA polymerase